MYSINKSTFPFNTQLLKHFIQSSISILKEITRKISFFNANVLISINTRSIKTKYS